MLVFGLVGPAAYAGGPDRCASAADDKAVSALMQRIKREHLYTSWTTLQCLGFFIEGCTGRRVEIAIREQHDPKCGGDPDTSPVVDRFRVYKRTGTIQWYDVENDQYLPFSKVHSMGQR
ncbi:MAG: hypothetical protein ACREWJ_02165 [Rhodoferax sp.]